ncbi:hypothetical protein T4B_1794 [Trichinella pseudospiralis]|uniref:Uncharacterized protein n=1 Tax=Trichinella pseudospiralis TaxID=6337 RepID=A0A0V1GH87_TRIPS|nr:hypothetical protein T4B_1794 [Trichinella pseudospiralis]
MRVEIINSNIKNNNNNKSNNNDKQNAKHYPLDQKTTYVS